MVAMITLGCVLPCVWLDLADSRLRLDCELLGEMFVL